MPPSFTSVVETSHVLSMNISVTPKKSMIYCNQQLLSGQVPTAGTAGQLAMF